MIVAVTPAGTVELRDRENFRDLKVLVEAAGLSEAALASALAGIARLTPEGNHAWVSQEKLRRWDDTGPPQAWLQSFGAMVDAVRRFGWVDDADASLRAHIERAPSR